MNRPDIQRFAHAFFERGWSFYPTRPHSKEPFSELLPLITRADGKRVPGWSPFMTELPSYNDVRTWFLIAPNANLALCPGSFSRLVIIDLDNQAAIDAFCDLCGIGDLYELGTPLVASRQGYHLYFDHPLEFEVRGSLGINKIDIKADGGCCTAPPSVHASGHVYKFLMSPAKYELQPLPAPVMDRMREEARKREVPSVIPPVYFPARDLSNYGRVSLRNALGDLSHTTSNRNDKLNRIAFNLGGLVATGVLDWATTYHALEACALSIGLKRSEVTPTLLSGLGDGTQKPRYVEDKRAQRQQSRRPRTLAELGAKGSLSA